MSIWIRNLVSRLQERPVVLLHGNVRDQYIDADGHVFENLTSLLRSVADGMKGRFQVVSFYDVVRGERRTVVPGTQAGEGGRARPAGGEFAASNPVDSNRQAGTPARVLDDWLADLTRADRNALLVLFYLDKLLPYRTSYDPDERALLLRLEKMIENITPNNRLILVALQDTMVPIEVYTSAPKVCVQAVPLPSKAERRALFLHRLGRDAEDRRLDLLADLTDGLFLRSLDEIAAQLRASGPASDGEALRIVNRYRVGEQEDHWATLSIQRLDDAMSWFIETEGVKGQDEAVRRVVDVLCLARSGLSGVSSGTGSKPRGVLFFAGPTGVGKTLVAKKLARFLFSTEEAFLRFDMSEMKEEHTIAKLIGAPPGYVGYEAGGMLTNAVRDKPFSVVLFDEVEKAHPRILDVFLQILDDGRLTDSRGQTVFFSETVVIFTSNVGSRTTDSRGRPAEHEQPALDRLLRDTGLSPEARKAAVREHFRQSVERFFMFELSRPELLNRFGNNIVPFNFIDSGFVQREIVSGHLARIRRDFEDRFRKAGHRLSIDDAVTGWFVQRYGDRIGRFGGRGIVNAIEDEIMVRLARSVLVAEFQGRTGVTFTVAFDRDAITVDRRDG